MFCAKCGKKIDDSVQFCNYCGAPTSNCTIDKRTIPNQVNPCLNNTMVNSERVLCPECHGSGETRSTLRIVISIAIILFIIFLQFIIQTIFLVVAIDEGTASGFFVLLLINVMIDAAVLYWGLRKSTCSACHGRGRIYL